MRSLVQKVRLARDHAALLRTMRKYAPNTYSVSEYQDRELENRIRHFDSQTARRLDEFITSHIEDHDSIARDMRNLIENHTTDIALVRMIEHFDYAVELGWNYAPSALRFIRDALSNLDVLHLNSRQMRIAIAIEDSQWDKEYTTGSGMMKRAYQFHACVTEAAVERPRDMDNIIDVARKHNPQTIQQVYALVDGVAPAISDGAL